jgi:digeranylgeranylglycerophospholipid reductase
MISIIGAGPAGCYAAYLLAKEGKEVQIFEEHKEIGLPIQCTGLVTSSIKDILKLKKNIIINEINKVKIFSKNNCLELKLKDKNLVLDRKKFDNYLADLAISKGAKIFLNYKFTDNKKNIIKIKYNNEQETVLKTDYLIGADGPLSQVAKSNNLLKKRKILTGIQAIVKLKNDNCIEFYPSIGTFAWVVPENKETCRIGVASYKNPKEDFNKLLKLKNIKNTLEIQGGLIPIYTPKLKTRKDNIYLIGDAASQVKATTGGGIIQGLKAAQTLKDSIINKKNYQKEWKKEIGKDLWVHLKIRNIMNKFKEKDWDLLIKLFKKDKIKSIIENFDRDYPTKFLFKLILNEPKLLYFLKFLL